MAGEPSVDEARDVVGRILASEVFRRAPRLQELLRYICEQQLTGRAEKLSEREIGQGVFKRPARYNPGEDNIVRVEIRNLRQRLQRYFETEGANESIVLSIPKGGYHPQFAYRTEGTGGDKVVSRSALQAIRSNRLQTATVAASFLVLGIWIGSRFPPAELEAEADQVAAVSQHPLWASVFDPSRDTLLVVPDATFSMCQRLLGRKVSLAEYLSSGIESEGRARAAVAIGEAGEMADVLRLITWREQTSFPDLMTVLAVMKKAEAFRSRVEVRFPRSLHVRDFKEKNVILLGPKRANPWVELFEPQLNFIFEYDEETGTPYFRNRSPRSGELEEYRRGGLTGISDDSYALVGLVRNLNDDGYVLLIAGADLPAADGAKDFIASEKRTMAMLSEFGLQQDGGLSCFEVLLKTSRLGGTSGRVEIVAHRRVGAERLTTLRE